MLVKVFVGVDVAVGSGVLVGVEEGTRVAVGIGVLVGVLDGVTVGVCDGVSVKVGDGVKVISRQMGPESFRSNGSRVCPYSSKIFTYDTPENCFKVSVNGWVML